MKRQFRPSSFLSSTKTSKTAGKSKQTDESAVWSRSFSIPIELLVNIDNFAHAVKLTWETEDDNVIAVLQGLGASTFLALLERSHLMDTISAQGERAAGKQIAHFTNRAFSLGSSRRAVDHLRAGQPSVAIAAQGRVRSHYARFGTARPDTVLSRRAGQRHPAGYDQRSETGVATREQSCSHQFLLGRLGERKFSISPFIVALSSIFISGTQRPAVK